MNLIYLLYFISAIITSLPVIVCHQFYTGKNYDIEHILMFIIIIIIIWTIITWLMYYYIFKKIKIGQFYVIVKILEIGITVFISVFFYNEKYSFYKYIGLAFAFLTLILVSI